MNMSIKKIFLHLVLWGLVLHLFIGGDLLYFALEDLMFSTHKIVDDVFFIVFVLLFQFYFHKFYLIKFFKQEKIKEYITQVLFTFASIIVVNVLIYFLITAFGYSIGPYDIAEYSQGNVEDFGLIQVLVNTLIAFFLSTAVCAGISTAEIAIENKRKRKEAEAKQKEAELRYLNSQFNPHFLHNTLNGLYSLAQEENAEKTTEAIVSLAELMRYPLKFGQERFVPLLSEVNFIHEYIRLEMLRLGDDYPISFFLTGNFDGCQVIPFCFVAIIENSFKYGVSHVHKTPIVFDLILEGDELRFVCENTIVINENHTSHGIGIDSLKKRLEHTYSDNYSLNISEEGNQYKVELIITNLAVSG